MSLLRTQPGLLAQGPREPPYPRTLVLRERTGPVSWELWLRKPPPALSGLVAGLWAGDADSDFARHRLLPSGELWVMFNLGPPQRVIEVGGTGCGQLVRAAFVCGLQESPLSVESVLRHPRAVTIRLLPLGAWALFGGLPLAELSNKVVDLESVLGSAAGVEALRQHLMEAPDLGAALGILEDWLLRRLCTGPSAHPVTRAALQRLIRAGGNVRVEALARELNVSARYLNGLFHREIGLSAKSMVRIVRLERALDRLDVAGDHDLSALAFDCGYYDQSHLNRDFRDLVGLTPSEYRARVFVAPGWREIGG
jgi:AraC-like DNA-binding protein